jgi:acyl-coenzyme A synthetase/AMP-(fatty) acid ligase
VACGRLAPVNFIEDVVERFPAARPALIEVAADGSRRMHHFGELFARSAGLSGAFAARGVTRGDVIITLLGSRPEWVLTMLACWRMGAVVLPCNTQLRRKDLELRARAAGPRLCVGESQYLGELPGGLPYMDVEELARVFDEDLDQESPAAIADLSPTDPAAIVFTSGTTGEPRGVVYPQRYLTGQGLQAEHWFGAREGDVAWCTAAPGWAKSTRNAFIAPWARGAVAVLHDARFDPAERLRLCDELGVNVLCQAPTEYRMLAKRGELAPVKSLRRLVSAGEPIEPDVIRLFRECLGLPVADGYGQTETGAISGARPGEDDPDRDGSMGRPLPGLQTRIEEGELQLRAASSPTFFDRYLDGSRFEGEWWPTGDRVREDDAGYLWFEGRSDDLILSSGYRIGPFEVESALVSHPAVAEAAAVAAPDPERGSVVRAVVVLRDGSAPSEQLATELQDHVKAQTAPYKYPRIVEFAAELPKTSSGKIRRAELRGS